MRPQVFFFENRPTLRFRSTEIEFWKMIFPLDLCILWVRQVYAVYCCGFRPRSSFAGKVPWNIQPGMCPVAMGNKSNGGEGGFKGGTSMGAANGSSATKCY